MYKFHDELFDVDLYHSAARKLITVEMESKDYQVISQYSCAYAHYSSEHAG